MKACPLCRRLHQVATRTTGDALWCPCGAILYVRHLDGGTVLTPSFSVAPAPVYRAPDDEEFSSDEHPA